MILSIRVVPNAARTEVAGMHGEAVKIRLQAPPVEGKANEALLAFLAGKLSLRRNELELVRGEKSREKRISIPGKSSAEVRGALGLEARSPDSP